MNKRGSPAGRLYVSFWHICLENLPEGRLENRNISLPDACTLLRDARVNNSLRCASRDDLLAPYKTRERQCYEELCSALRTHHGCDLHLEDFLCPVDEEHSNSKTIFPLDLVQLKAGDSLLIVTCNYEFLSGSGKGDGGFEERRRIAADSIAFNLLEAL